MFEERTASIISSQEELVENQTQQDLTEEQACYDKVNSKDLLKIFFIIKFVTKNRKWLFY